MKASWRRPTIVSRGRPVKLVGNLRLYETAAGGVAIDVLTFRGCNILPRFTKMWLPRFIEYGGYRLLIRPRIQGENHENVRISGLPIDCRNYSNCMLAAACNGDPTATPKTDSASPTATLAPGITPTATSIQSAPTPTPTVQISEEMRLSGIVTLNDLRPAGRRLVANGSKF